jgi:hypothetical protein
MKDRTISTVYSVRSFSVVTAQYYGVRGYYLYHLFDDNAMSFDLKKRYDIFFSGLHQKVWIDSVEDWMDGKNEYKPEDVSGRVRASIIEMLKRVGIE